MQRADRTAAEPTERAQEGGSGRTPSDVATLLVELGRVAKGRQFYPDGHPQLGELFERGLRAFQAELARHGPLELEVRSGSFWLPEAGVAVGRGRLDELARELVVRAVRRLRFDPSLDLDSFRALVQVLVTEREALENAGGFERVLYTTARRGIQVNQVDYAALLARGALAPAGEDDLPALAAPGDGAPPSPAADPLAELLAAAATDPSKVEAALEAAPLEARPGDDRAAELVALLRQLDECREDVAHAGLVKQIVERAAALSDEGLADEGYRAILVFSAQAADRARSAAQREAAGTGLRELARGARYRDLVSRACAPGAAASIRAAQVLLQLGVAVVPSLLHDIEREGDPDRRGQMSGILIAMGEKATPEILAAIQSGEPRRMRLAVRFAGEIQNPAAVPALQRVLRGSDAEMRREAAKSLVKIGDPTALECLVDALASPLGDVPSLAAFCLGVSGSPRALEALLAALRRAGRTGEFELARESIRALGRLGRPEATPELAAVLSRVSFFQRRKLRELKLAAAAALARLPGSQAQQALAAASRSRDPRVREAASRALGRGKAEAASA